MRHIAATSHSHPALPRGLFILAAAGASWALMIGAGMGVSQMFSWLVATI